MACLNIPLDVRYKRENIYLAGVLPGPKAPSLQQVNHFLRPIVQELLPLWNSGVDLSRTALRSYGRVVRAALVKQLYSYSDMNVLWRGKLRY